LSAWEGIVTAKVITKGIGIGDTVFLVIAQGVGCVRIFPTRNEIEGRKRAAKNRQQAWCAFDQRVLLDGNQITEQGGGENFFAKSLFSRNQQRAVESLAIPPVCWRRAEVRVVMVVPMTYRTLKSETAPECTAFQQMYATQRQHIGVVGMVANGDLNEGIKLFAAAEIEQAVENDLHGLRVRGD